MNIDKACFSILSFITCFNRTSSATPLTDISLQSCFTTLCLSVLSDVTCSENSRERFRSQVPHFIAIHSWHFVVISHMYCFFCCYRLVLDHITRWSSGKAIRNPSFLTLNIWYFFLSDLPVPTIRLISITVNCLRMISIELRPVATFTAARELQTTFVSSFAVS